MSKPNRKDARILAQNQRDAKRIREEQKKQRAVNKAIARASKPKR